MLTGSLPLVLELPCQVNLRSGPGLRQRGIGGHMDIRPMETVIPELETLLDLRF
jgi:hypothetical protein